MSAQLHKSGPMRILQVITRMNVGGPAIEIDQLMKSLDPEKFESHLVTGACQSNEIDFLENKVIAYSYRKIDSMKRSISPIRDLLSIFKLMWIIYEFKPHIIHTHTAKAGLLGRLASLPFLRSVRVVHTFHGHVLEGYFSKPVTIFFRSIEKLLSKTTHQFIVVGTSIKSELLSYGIGSKDRFNVIHPGVELEDTLSPAEESVVSENFNLAFVGRLTQIKRVDRLIESVKLVDLKEGNSKIFLHIIGDGELRNSLQTLALKLGIRVKFYGWQANVLSLIAQMDCVIITSDNEGTPISLIEAGLLKKPTISTNVGSVNEVIIHEVTGLICNLDPEDISGAILKIMNNNELALKYGTAAQQYLTKEFSVRQFVSSHESLYEFVFDSITP